MRKRLIERPAMPYELDDQLVGEIGVRLEWELVQKRRMTAAEARRLMKSVRDTATPGSVARDHGEHSIEREMRRRMQDEELGPEAILVHLRDGEIRHVEAGLALRAGIDAEKARQLLYGMDKRGIAALCARAGFGVAHYATLRMTLDLAEKVENKGRDAHYSASNLQFIQRQYQNMLADQEMVAPLVDG